jgi:type VI secretion system protein ImpE
VPPAGVVQVTAKELLDSGQLSLALTQVTEEVKANPGDPWRRATLFDLLCFTGDLDRAAKQLDIISLQGAEVELAVQPYREAIAAEQARRRLYSQGSPPHFLSPVSHAALQLKAIELYRQQDYTGALSALEESEEARPLTPGKLNSVEFDDLRDADDLLGPFLEAFVEGRYTWIPWREIKTLQVPEPKKLRDLVWTPAFIELHSAPLGAVMLPALYVDSYRDPNDQVKLGRLTEWRTDVPGFSVGAGQKIVSAGEQDFGILELRSVEFTACQLPA